MNYKKIILIAILGLFALKATSQEELEASTPKWLFYSGYARDTLGLEHLYVISRSVGDHDKTDTVLWDFSGQRLGNRTKIVEVQATDSVFSALVSRQSEGMLLWYKCEYFDNFNQYEKAFMQRLKVRKPDIDDEARGEIIRQCWHSGWHFGLSIVKDMNTILSAKLSSGPVILSVSLVDAHTLKRIVSVPSGNQTRRYEERIYQVSVANPIGLSVISSKEISPPTSTKRQ